MNLLERSILVRTILEEERQQNRSQPKKFQLEKFRKCHKSGGGAAVLVKW